MTTTFFTEISRVGVLIVAMASSVTRPDPSLWEPVLSRWRENVLCACVCLLCKVYVDRQKGVV